MSDQTPSSPGTDPRPPWLRQMEREAQKIATEEGVDYGTVVAAFYTYLTGMLTEGIERTTEDNGDGSYTHTFVRRFDPLWPLPEETDRAG